MILSMVPETSKDLKNIARSRKIKIACFPVEHNIPFNIGYIKNLIQTVYPDSKIESELTFEKTNAQAVIRNVTGETTEYELISLLQKKKVSIVDGSIDKNKIFGINYSIVIRMVRSLYKELINFDSKHVTSFIYVQITKGIEEFCTRCI